MSDPTTAIAVREESAIAPFRAAIEARIDKIAELLPESMDQRRFASVSLMALTKNPDLLKCDRSSFVMAVLEAAEVGLEPTGGVGGAHLVPFKGKVQLIYDYRGIQHLIREGGGGEIKTVLVYEGDYFKVYEGTEKARIRHTPKFLTKDPTQIAYVYAVPLDHPEKFEVMTKAEIDGIRARSKAANAGPWVSDFGAMARKSVLKRISAWLPLKPSTRAALDRDTQREIGAGEEDEPVVSRTASVRERVRARREPVKNGPGAAETTEVDSDATPDVSAAGQAATAGETTEGDVAEFCDARLVPPEGPVELCILPAGHDGTSHQAESGKRWNA